MEKSARFYYFLSASAMLVFLVGMAFFFNFTAEDAYITYRYSENLVNFHELVFNQGEAINALTSPMHGILSAALFLLFRNTVLTNKILSLFMLLGSAFLLWRRYKDYPEYRSAAIILILASPHILLWTFGGLETVILLFLVTLVIVLADTVPSASLEPKWLYAIFILAGFGFLTRFDSILFFAPFLSWAAVRSRSIKHVFFAGLLGALIPVAWLLFSQNYYGDIFPSSFYVKPPTLDNPSVFIRNRKYIAYNLIYTGIVPMLLFFLLFPVKPFKKISSVARHFASTWGLYLGVLLELSYGLSMATKHMMFSFRYFVPYLPAVVILILDLLVRLPTQDQKSFNHKGIFSVFAKAFLLALLAFQTYQIHYSYNVSVNGLSHVGEYSNLSVKSYIEFMKILKNEAFDIQHHWESTANFQGRQPRIYTYAEGILPYTYRNSFVFGKLVSNKPRIGKDQKYLLASDYIQILTPRNGTIEEQLPDPAIGYIPVSSYTMVFDGAEEQFLVFYNPTPQLNFP